MAISNQGDQIAVGTTEAMMILINLSAPGQLLHLDQFSGHTGGINSIVFSPDGKTLISGGEDKTVRIWDLISKKEIRRFYFTSSVSSVGISPTGRYVLVGCLGVPASLWSVSTGQLLVQFDSIQQNSPAVAFAHTSEIQLPIAVGSLDGAVCIYSLNGEKAISLGRQNNQVDVLSFSPDDRWLASGGIADQIACFWDLSTRSRSEKVFQGTSLKQSLGRSFKGQVWGFTALAFSPDNRFILAGSLKSVRLWEYEPFPTLLATYSGNEGRVSVGFVGKQPNWIVTAGDTTIRFWKQSPSIELCCLVIFRDGSWLVMDADGRFDFHNLKKTRRMTAPTVGSATLEQTEDTIKGITWKLNPVTLPESIRKMPHRPAQFVISLELLRTKKEFETPNLFYLALTGKVSPVPPLHLLLTSSPEPLSSG